MNPLIQQFVTWLGSLAAAGVIALTAWLLHLRERLIVLETRQGDSIKVLDRLEESAGKRDDRLTVLERDLAHIREDVAVLPALRDSITAITTMHAVIVTGQEEIKNEVRRMTGRLDAFVQYRTRRDGGHEE